MRFKALTLGLAAVLAVSCTDQATTPTALNEAVPTPTFDFINGPAEPGNSSVFRFEDAFYFATNDSDPQVIARYWQANEEQPDFCPDPGAPAPWIVQDILTHPGGVLGVINSLAKSDGEIPIVIYPYFSTAPPGTDFCSEWLPNFWLYQGTVKIVQTDNNVFWFLGTGGTNSYGWSSHGFVYDQDGNKYRYGETQRIIAKGMCCFPDIPLEDEDFTVKVPVENIRIHPIANGQ